jgi:hypothetical protein
LDSDLEVAEPGHEAGTGVRGCCGAAPGVEAGFVVTAGVDDCDIGAATVAGFTCV